MRELGGLDRGLDRLFQRPAVGELEHVLARRDLHHDAVDAGVDRALDVLFHAAREREYLRAQIALDDFLDRLVVGRRDDRHAGFDAVHARFGQASAMRIFSSFDRMTPVCCSPSRKVRRGS